MDLDVKVAEIVVVGNGANPGDSVLGSRSAAPSRTRVTEVGGFPHGSAMSLSVSLMILFGSAMAEGGQAETGTETGVVIVDRQQNSSLRTRRRG